MSVQQKKAKNDRRALRIAILAYLDRSANSIRPAKIKQEFKKRGHTVVLVDSTKLNKRSHGFDTASAIDHTKRSWRFPCLVLSAIGLFNELSRYKICSWFSPIETYFTARVLEAKLREGRYDIIIAESEMLGYVFTRKLPGTLLLDAAAPAAEEMLYSGMIPRFIYNRVVAMRLRTFAASTYVNYHWYRYTDYVRKHIYKGKNLIQVDYGCDLHATRAQYSKVPRVVFLGNLGGYWNNFPLLANLSKQYPFDVYGHPAPHPKYGLHYKGYAPSTDIVSQYQFGLITITKDELRKSSFSSKHLEYLSYGLPVLTPDWRKDRKLAPVSIPYNEKTFRKQIERYSNQARWQALADKSYETAKQWSWDRVLQPMVELLEKSAGKR